jgi:hypothetical protein
MLMRIEDQVQTLPSESGPLIAPTIQQVIEETCQTYSSKYCLHPTQTACSGAIIRAHAVQRNGSLSKIARNGCVCSFKSNNIADIACD